MMLKNWRLTCLLFLLCFFLPARVIRAESPYDQKLVKFKVDWYEYITGETAEASIDEQMRHLDRLEARYFDITEAVDRISAERKRLEEISQNPLNTSAGKPAKQHPAGKTSRKWFAQYEFWLIGNPFESKHDLQAPRYGTTNTFYVASEEVKVGPGGIKVGRSLGSQKKSFGYGASVSYVEGPKQFLTLGSISSFFGGQFEANETYETRFWRAMLEIQKRFVLSSEMEFKISAGAGIGWGEMELFYRQGTMKSHWQNLTVEVMPSLVFPGKRFNYEVGVGFAHFPAYSGGANFPEMNWNPIGLKLGVEF